MNFFSEKEIEKKIETLRQSGREQVSIKPIRDRQEEKLNHKIRKRVLEIMETEGIGKIEGPLFFVGSVDFMVNRENGKTDYFILEANGGSSRGFSTQILPFMKVAYDGFLSGLDFCLSENPVVIIGYPKNDLVFYEKFYLARSFSKYFQEKGLTGKDDFLSVREAIKCKKPESPLIILDEYKEILKNLRIEKGWVFLGDLKIDYIIGDGLTRRHPGITEFTAREHTNTIIANSIYQVTDDKSLTFEAVLREKEKLKKFGVEPIKYWRARDKAHLTELCLEGLRVFPDIIIKPYGGSGGAGIDIIRKADEIEDKINKSVAHFHEKFGIDRNPYPYTVCQRVTSTPVDWKGNKHQFDLRVYVARAENRVVPVGTMVRIALEPYTGILKRKNFVVNLSGYGGVDTDRGLGISTESLKLLNLTEEDFVNIYLSSCTVMAYINNNYNDFRKYFFE